MDTIENACVNSTEREIVAKCTTRVSWKLKLTQSWNQLSIKILDLSTNRNTQTLKESLLNA